MVSILGFGSPSSSSVDLSRSPSPSTPAVKEVNPLNPKGLKPCCACPETKSARDDCFLKSNPDSANENCASFIEAHKACMRGYGFKV